MRLALAGVVVGTALAVAPAAHADTPRCVAKAEFDQIRARSNTGLDFIEHVFFDGQPVPWRGEAYDQARNLIGVKYHACGWTTNDVLVPIAYEDERGYRVIEICQQHGPFDWSC